MNTPQYRMTRIRTLTHRLVGLLPPPWREWSAEHLLRRSGAPGPAAEHVVQYLLSAAKPGHGKKRNQHATVAEGADHFYARQYRQFLNASMGAFAMTATQVLLASGGTPEGHLWSRHRRTYAALLEQTGGAKPILVINHQTVAVPIFIPRLKREGERDMLQGWLAGAGDLPQYYQTLMHGIPLDCEDMPVKACERSQDGIVLLILQAVLQTKRLALLALHPHDDDAMGLHITLYGVEPLEPERLQRDYGLDPDTLAPYREAARQTDHKLMFCVGGTEEVFTQCSQNLFIKRPAPPPYGQEGQAVRQGIPPLGDFLASQFEALQVTVSAIGLPGASPRNGDIGKAAFLGRRKRKVFVLVPYHPGNTVHGHAAKLWTNPYGSLVLSDDIGTLVRITVSGPSRCVSQRWVQRVFPDIAAQVKAQHGHNGKALPEPEYWFLQEVSELVRQREPLACNSLDPARPTCSISAGGQAHHGKKPGYFAADSLPPYDQALQHRREKSGRPVDPTGTHHNL